MKTLVVYETGFGNTARVAGQIADGLGRFSEVTVVPVAEAPERILPEFHLVVVGGPTHAFSMTRPSTRKDAVRQGGSDPGVGIREWLADVEMVRSQRIACFDTRVGKMRHIPGSAARSAARLLRHRGFGRLHDVRSFFVEDVAGPLLEGELERAQGWGTQLGASLETSTAGRS